ncbi:MAG: SIS domain-containing protein [Betaproteobacteria bacterium]|nr:SIS domain-containing protein [Betaproteobacteria bacterium]
MRSQVLADLQQALAVHEALVSDDALQGQLAEVAGWGLDALRRGGKILFAGNGGSFADAQHLAAEFVSRLQFDRAPLPAIALATNGSSMSAIGNDYGYDQVFARELRALAAPHDVFVAITTSGNSANILAAAQAAAELSVRTVGFTGASGGRLAGLCPCLRIPSARTERIQEGHILLGHILCALVENAFFGKETA